MRGVTAALVLTLAACSTAGGDTTTTGSIAEASTTSPGATTTTTSASTDEECTERDGALRTRRGFVCPPHVVDLIDRGSFGRPDRRQRSNSLVAGAQHLPGTYETRRFATPLRFTRTEPFQSDGESTNVLTLDFPSGREVVAFAGETARQMARLPDAEPDNRPEGYEWTADVTSREITVDGHTGVVTEYRVDCLEESSHCNFRIEGIERWSQIHESRVGVVVVEVATGEVVTVVVMTANADDFDAYWAEVALPILDSIEFLDH